MDHDENPYAKLDIAFLKAPFNKSKKRKDRSETEGEKFVCNQNECLSCSAN